MNINEAVTFVNLFPHLTESLSLATMAVAVR